MRVTIVSRIYAPEPSAASFYLSTLARELADAGHEVEVVTVTPPHGLSLDDDARVRVRRAPVLRDSRGYVRGYVQYVSFDVLVAFRLLFARKADVYFVEPPPTTGAIVRVVAWLLRRPYVYDAADVWSDAARVVTRSRAVLKVLRALELFAVRGAAQAVTISSAVGERFTLLGANTAFTTVGFGVDAEMFRYEEPSADADARCFVYPGTFSEVQGAGVLVEGFARFSRRTPGYRLVFVGNGTDGDRLLEIAREQGVNDLQVRGAVPPRDLLGILANATASLASLRPDGGYEYAFATKLYTPMAIGCPVIFAGPGPTADFIREAEAAQRSGFAVRYDADEIASAMHAIARKPLSAQERRQLSEWTRTHHSLSGVAHRVLSVLEAVAAAGWGGRRSVPKPDENR